VVSDGDTISIVPAIAGGSKAYAMPPPPALSNEEIQRYSRHLIIPEVSMDGQRKLKEASGEIPQITSVELKALMDQGKDLYLLDVRTPQEYEICRIDGAKLIPLNRLMEEVHRLNMAQEIIVHCKSGVRSRQAIKQLQQVGFKKLRNLEGGILDWARAVDPSLPVY